MRVSRADVLFALERLLQIYPKPKHGAQEIAELAEIFHRELDDLDVEVFRAGVNAYCKSDARYFPKPGELRAIGQRIAKPEGSPENAMATWERAWPERGAGRPLPCPVCGAVDTWADSSPFKGQRRFVPHDPAPHQAAGVPFIGRSTADLVGAAPA
jgi:hypothetical protein